MLNYIIRRLLWAGVLFVGVTLITYVLFFLLLDRRGHRSKQQKQSRDVEGDGDGDTGDTRPVQTFAVVVSCVNFEVLRHAP